MCTTSYFSCNGNEVSRKHPYTHIEQCPDWNHSLNTCPQLYVGLWNPPSHRAVVKTTLYSVQVDFWNKNVPACRTLYQLGTDHDFFLMTTPKMLQWSVQPRSTSGTYTFTVLLTSMGFILFADLSNMSSACFMVRFWTTSCLDLHKFATCFSENT